MKQLKHANISAFIGAYSEDLKFCIVMEFSRGSLCDYLEDDSIPLDEMFISSFLFDLIKVIYANLY